MALEGEEHYREPEEAERIHKMMLDARRRKIGIAVEELSKENGMSKEKLLSEGFYGHELEFAQQIIWGLTTLADISDEELENDVPED